MGYTPLTPSIVTMSAEVGYTAERVLTAGNNIVKTDGGANSTVTLQPLKTSTQTGDVTLTSTHNTGQYCDATSAAIAVTLPAASTTDKVFIIKKTDSGGNAVTVTRAGSDTIEGATTFVLTAQYDWVIIQSDGSAVWKIIGKTVPAASAPADAQYLTLATNATLTVERVFTPGNNVYATDAGAGSTYTVQVDTHTVNTGTTVNLTAGSNAIQLCDAATAGGAVTVNLPAISGATGKVFTVKKFDSGSNTVTIDGSGSETIDGATTYVISIPYQAVDLVCTSGGWALY